MDKYIVVIDKNRLIYECVDNYHIDTMQKIVFNNYSTSYNVKNIKNYFYPIIVSEDLNIVIILINGFLATMYIPLDYNTYQFNKIKDFVSVIESYNKSGINFGLLFNYDNKIYNSLGDIVINKRLKR